MNGLLLNLATLESDPRLSGIEAHLNLLTELLTSQRMVKDFYTTAEAATELGKRPYTVREWCRYKRVNAVKRACGRGRSKDWAISHAELTRIKNEGLLPLDHGSPRS
jgi:Helix-turn-helix domain